MATDLQELLEKSSFRFAVVAHGSTYALLEGSNAQMHRALFNRIMESPEENLLRSMSGGVEELLRPDTKNFGILAEGVVADHMRGLHCDLYSVGHLNDRSYAFAFPKDNRESGDGEYHSHDRLILMASNISCIMNNDALIRFPKHAFAACAIF